MKWISRLAELIEDWHYWIQHNGWRSSLRAIGQDLFWLPYRRMHFIVVTRSLLEPIPNLIPKMAFEVREFKPSDVDLVRQMDRPSEARLCARRLACGHKGFLAVYQGKPAGHAWGCNEVEPTLERVKLKLNTGDFLCADAYTAPVFRSQGLQTVLTLACFRLFRDMGCRRSIAYIERRNHPSLAVWRKVGCQVTGSFEFIRIGPWRWVRYHY
jgi:GNAT superfamily N-acetyltransferase